MIVHERKEIKFDDSKFLQLMEDISFYKRLATGRYLIIDTPPINENLKEDSKSIIKKRIPVPSETKTVNKSVKKKSIPLTERVKQLL